MARFGVLMHRGASQARVGTGERNFSVHVRIYREPGAARARQYCSVAWVPKSGRRRRPGGMRQGPMVCGPTPTLASKRSIRALVSRNWS